MPTNVKKSKINFKGKTVNIGIDMHKAFWHITAVVETKVVMAFTLASPKYSAFKKILSQFVIMSASLTKLVLEALASMTS